MGFLSLGAIKPNQPWVLGASSSAFFKNCGYLWLAFCLNFDPWHCKDLWCMEGWYDIHYQRNWGLCVASNLSHFVWRILYEIEAYMLGEKEIICLLMCFEGWFLFLVWKSVISAKIFFFLFYLNMLTTGAIVK